MRTAAISLSVVMVVVLSMLSSTARGFLATTVRVDFRKMVARMEPFSSSSSKATTLATRINKCLGELSRRAADEAIGKGRVTVNGNVAMMGQKVCRGDVVKLDGVIQQWEAAAQAKQTLPALSKKERKLTYIKYHKPVGVICTSDMSDPDNIISAGGFDKLPQRLFTVGRLDKDSSGVILLTSDGRVNAALLHRSQQQSKVYEVEFDRPLTRSILQKLRDGIEISTPMQRDTADLVKGEMVTVSTLPCEVEPLTLRSAQITLTEGRNRQIRRMTEAVGLRVKSLRRTSFAGITVEDLDVGDWRELNEAEMAILQQAMKESSDIDHGRVSRTSPPAVETSVKATPRPTSAAARIKAKISQRPLAQSSLPVYF